MKFTNKRALVVGTGKSGVAAVNLLNHVGAQVTLLEGNTSLSSEEIMKRFPKEDGKSDMDWEEYYLEIFLGTRSEEHTLNSSHSYEDRMPSCA